MLIGLDASTVKTGFSFGGPENGSPKGGVWPLPGADELNLDRTLSGAAEMLRMWIEQIKAEHVFIEAPLNIVDRNHAAHTAMALIQLTGALRAAAHRAGCKVRLCAISTVRKHFIGHGHLPGRQAKQAVMDRCRQLGWNYLDDNQADSCAVWSYGMATTYPSWRPSSLQLFAGARA